MTNSLKILAGFGDITRIMCNFTNFLFTNYLLLLQAKIETLQKLLKSKVILKTAST